MSLPLKKGDIVKGSQNLKSYFISFSDGGASFTGGAEYTEKIIKQIKANNTKVMAYFIGNQTSNDYSTFKKMYGPKESKTIEVAQLLPLAKSLNEMFLNGNG